jgi:ATP-binding cassette subfamily B protein
LNHLFSVLTEILTMSFPFYKQHDKMDCGPTCLQMIAKFYGKRISLQSLRERAQIGKEGVNLLGISEAAEAIGFKTQAIRLSYEALVNQAILPSILHWEQNHFIVLYKASKNKLYVADPGRGLITYNPEEFKRFWISNYSGQSGEGIALLIEPTTLLERLGDTEEREQTDNKFKNIFHYAMRYKKLIIQFLIGLCVASALQLVLPFLTQSIVDVGINTGNIHFVYIILAAQLALFAGRLVVEFVRSWILLHVSTRINVSILTDFIIKLMKLPVSFFDSKNTGDILQRMSDHKRIESFLTGSSLSIFFSLINLIVFSIVLAIFNKYIFLVFAFASGLYALWVILFLKKRRTIDYKKFKIASKEQNATIQMVQAMQEIKLYGCERSIRWNWESLQARLFKLRMKELSINQWQQTGAFFVNEGKNIFITFLAAKAVIDGQLTLGSMLAVQYIIGQLNSPVEQMIGFIQAWQNARISLDRMNEIHGMEDEDPLHRSLMNELPPAFMRKLAGGTHDAYSGAGAEFSPANGLLPGRHLMASEASIISKSNNEDVESFISFNNVSFTYPGAGNEPVLRHIDISIPIGKVTAIVGASGSGKTTLLKLLLKFYEPQKGELKIGNTALNSINHKAWRRHCGVVMQESFIFSDTIAKNIAVGDEKIDRLRLQHAATIANVGDFIESLPLGFNTKIGVEGMGISMGQKQRILIARSVYRDPDFIFFDEATNSLDANNESAIIHNLHSFFKGRTVVVVAHRLSTVKHADQIVVLNKGHISEKGTHQELINLKGAYYTLIKNQLELGE